MEGTTGIKHWLHMHFAKQHRKRKFLIKYFYTHTVKADFKKAMGYELDLEHPKTLNEKLQWVKFYVRDPRYTQCADKYEVRKYVEKKLGGAEHLVPLYGVYDSVAEIDIDALPEEFVLKPNHSCGCVILCHDKSQMDWEKEADKMELWLRQNYYYRMGEWQYKNIPPKIVCEKLLQGEIVDYKFFCCAGKPQIVRGVSNRKNGHYNSTWWDLNFHVLTSDLQGELVRRPPHWEEMLALSEKLSEDFPFVRVDFYDLEGKVYFGELTFTPNNGMDAEIPDDWDEKMGELFDLSDFDPKHVTRAFPK